MVSTATCAAAAVMAEPVAHLEEEVESIVEKHQLEEMERQPNVEKEVLEDDIEPELQRIKDEEDAMEAEENNAPRQPDIPVVIPVSVEEAKIEKEVEEIVEVAVQAKPLEAASQPPPPAPVALPAASQRPQPTASTHVKTPDEVEDLPEHEAVEPEELQISPTEEKIVLDLQEKEVEKEVKSPLGLESEGAQEQRELSEVIVSAQQIEEPSEHEEPQPSALKVQIDKLKGVLASVVSYYEDLLKSAKLLQNDKLADDVGLHLEQSINLLSSLDSEADEDEAVLSGVRAGASQTMELVRKCMKLAIELIEAEAEGNKSFMEYLHSEPDLILHCQEIETYCNNLLPSTTQNDQEDKQQEAEIEIDEGKLKYIVLFLERFILTLYLMDLLDFLDAYFRCSSGKRRQRKVDRGARRAKR